MRLTGYLVAICIVASNVPAAGGQEPRQLTEAEAVRLGLERNGRVRAADAEAAAAAASFREARAQRLPTIRTQSGFTRVGGDLPSTDIVIPGVDTAFAFIPIQQNRYLAEISVEQPLFTGGRLTYEARAAEHDVESAEWLARQERVDLAFEIRQAYWNLYGALALLDATEAAIAYIDEHVEDVENRYEAGTVLLSEVLAARTRRSEILLERVEAENAVRTGRLVLNQLVGLPLDEPVDPVDDVRVEPPDTTGPVPTDVLGRPDVLALEEQVNALRARMESVRGSWMPELGVSGRYVYARPNPYSFIEQDEFRGTWEAGFSLRWSVWEGGARSARTARAREQLRGAEARLEDAREAAAVEIARERLEIRRATEAVAVAELNVEQAEEAFRVAQDQFAEGIALSAQVLDAEQAYRNALARRARAIADYRIAAAAVVHSMGEI